LHSSRHSVVGYISTTWRIRLNLCFLRCTRVHNTNGCFCTANSRKSLYFTMGNRFPQNCLLSCGDLDPIKFMIPWASPSPQSKGITTASAVFAHDCRVSLYFTIGRPFPPPQNRPFHRRSGPPSNTWLPEPTRVLNPNSMLIGSAVLQGSLV